MLPEESGTGSLPRNGLAPGVGHAPCLIILGSFPGNRSLFHTQYYTNPQNQIGEIIGKFL
jgi:G:T/U-mismatch repair DNA glycosylase